MMGPGKPGFGFWVPVSEGQDGWHPGTGGAPWVPAVGGRARLTHPSTRHGLDASTSSAIHDPAAVRGCVPASPKFFVSGPRLRSTIGECRASPASQLTRLRPPLNQRVLPPIAWQSRAPHYCLCAHLEYCAVVV